MKGPLLWIAAVGLGLSACSKKSASKTDATVANQAASTPSATLDGADEPEPRRDATGIELDSSVPKNERAMLHHDLNRLSTLNLAEDAEFQRLLGTPDLSPASLQSWLGARMHYVFSETTLPTDDFVQRCEVTRQGDLYPNHAKLSLAGGQDWVTRTNKWIAPNPEAPSTNSPNNAYAETSSAIVMAANVGAALYTDAKENFAFDTQGNRQSQVRSFEFNGQKVEIDSPRVGLIQISKALLIPYLNNDPKADSNAILHLSTFFHEARHSDGNGHSLSFSHAICPRGHDYARSYSCDLNANGPYLLGAKFMAAMARACGNCSAKEMDKLRLLYLDMMSRDLTAWEPMSAERSKTNKLLTVLNLAIVSPDLPDPLAKRLGTVFEILMNHRAFLDDILSRGAVEWDESPERVTN